MGTVNIALNRPATASNYIAPYNPARVVDGNVLKAGSRWLCRAPGTMQIDLGGFYKVDQWSIQDMTVVGFDRRYVNNRVDLYLSMDGNSWTMVDSMLNGATTKTFPIINTRFARLSIGTKNGFSFNNQMASIVDFKLFAADPTPNTLSGLVVTGNNGVVQAYTPAFAPATQQYNSSVGADVASVTIKPTATDSKAVVKVNNVIVAAGASSVAIPLQTGANTVTMTVEPVVGNVMTYTLVITKKVSNLTGISVKNGNDAVVLTPTFDPSVKEYTGSVDFSDANFNVPSINVTPTADSNTKITCNGQTITSGTAITITNPVVGDNVLQITASALDGSNPTTYKVTINRKHSTYLKTIVTTPGTVTPNVSKTAGVAYSIKAGVSQSQCVVTLTVEDSQAYIDWTIDGVVNTAQGNISSTIVLGKTAKATTVNVRADGVTATPYNISIGK